jgi:hypothetical protein
MAFGPPTKRQPIQPVVPEWMKPKLGRTMRFTREYLAEILGKAFDVGNSSLYELKDQLVEEVLANIKKGDNEPWAILSLKDLKALPNDSRMFHSMFGEGIITIKMSDNGKVDHFVQFSGFRFDLSEEVFPWTEKIQVLS